MTLSVDTISEIAARWAVRVDAGPLGLAEQQELDAWLAADPRHRGAYIRVRAQWADLDRLAALNGPLGVERGPTVAGRLAGRTVAPSRPWSRRQLLAASVAAAAASSGGLTWFALRDRRERYASGIGEVRRIALNDGSTVLLNTASEVRVDLGDRQRRLQLIRGEALFEVAHDASRPFIVLAKDTAVRAVGTAFAVRLEGAQVDVTVTEGIVDVGDPRAVSGPGPIAPVTPRPDVKRVAAHERVIIARTQVPDVRRIAPEDAERQLAWRSGLVSFDGESLQVAVAEINRHNRRQIVVTDPGLAARPIVGVFRATDLEGFSAAAAAALKVHAIVDGDTILLEPAARPAMN